MLKFIMGNINSINSINKINFELMQSEINNRNTFIINTLNDDNQECLIKGTISSDMEVRLLNESLHTMKDRKIIVYGKNCNDEKIFNKYKQLIELGFTNVYIYIGGLFEWLLLQEVYGDEQFPTTSYQLDLLKYK